MGSLRARHPHRSSVSIALQLLCGALLRKGESGSMADNLTPEQRSYRSEEHTSELQPLRQIVCRLLLEKIASAVASSKMASLTICDFLAGTSRRAVMASLLTLRGILLVFFFNDTATTEIYTLSLHDALPISKLREHEPELKAAGIVHLRLH